MQCTYRLFGNTNLSAILTRTGSNPILFYVFFRLKLQFMYMKYKNLTFKKKICFLSESDLKLDRISLFLKLLNYQFFFLPKTDSTVRSSERSEILLCLPSVQVSHPQFHNHQKLDIHTFANLKASIYSGIFHLNIFKPDLFKYSSN
jgi:hypothetical protein